MPRPHHTVAFLPVLRNPYQQLLAEAIEAHGWEVDLDGQLATVLRSLLTTRPPDALHVHWTHPFFIARTRSRAIVKTVLFLALIGLAQIRRVPIVWTVHNRSDHGRRNPRIERMVNRALGRRATAILVHDASSVELARRWAGPRTTVAVAPHGHYLDAYPTPPDRAICRSHLGLPRDGVVFASIGALRTYKRLELIAQAFRDVAGPSDRLVIGGAAASDFDPSPLEQERAGDERVLVEDRFLTAEEISERLGAADVFVHAAADALTSGSIVLALGFGLVVVAGRSIEAAAMLESEGAVLIDDMTRESLGAALRTAAARSSDTAARAANRRLALEMNWDRAAQTAVCAYEGHLTNAAVP